jgi:hypothetical protein
MALLLATGSLVAGCTATPSAHGDPDLGGQVLTALKSVEPALPDHAQVLLHQAHEPTWDSCGGRSGTFGWSNVSVNIQFRTNDTNDPADAVLASADHTLSAAGWKRSETFNSPLGPGARCSRTVPGGAQATAALTPGTPGSRAQLYWDLTAFAPPQGQRVNGC